MQHASLDMARDGGAGLELGIVAIVRSRGRVPAAALDALERGGIGRIEVTFGTPGCLDLVEQAAARERPVGMGTVRTVDDARHAIAAGAAFLVTPTFVPDVVAAARAASLPIVCGALTPSEIDAAWRAGADAVKVFPIDAVGGMRYLRAVRAPLADVALVPTGGIGEREAEAYAREGCVGVGVGSALVDDATLADGAWDELVARARRLDEAWRRGLEARGAG